MRRCLGEALLRDTARLDCGDQRAANACDDIVEQVVTQAQRIGPGGDRAHCSFLHPDGRADRLHLQRVGHDEPREAELASQDVVEDVSTHRGWRVAALPHDDVRGHDRLRPGLDGRAERCERRIVQSLDDGKREVRVHRGVAVPGEVLRAGGHPRALKAAYERSDMPGHELGVGAERANSDHGVLRIGVDVGNGREIEIDARSSKLRAERRRHALGEFDVVDDAQRRVARVRAPGRRLEPCDIAALFVDCEHEVGSLGAQIVRQRSELLATFHIPGVQDDPAESIRELPTEPVGHGWSLEPGKDAAGSESLELAAHALTAPAVKPNAIFRCTSRKKITTGIAVSVDAAMSPPQSVFRPVP